MRSPQQHHVLAALGLLALLLAAWWWFAPVGGLARPLAPVPPAPVDAHDEAVPAGSHGSVAPPTKPEEERQAVAPPDQPPLADVLVRAVDAFGLPVEGAQVLVRRDGEATAQPFARTGARGTCRVALGAPVLFVRAHDDAVGTSIEVQVPSSMADAEPIVLPLLRPIVVRGRVLLKDEPVGAVRVMVSGELRLARGEPGIVAPLHALEVGGPDRSFTFEAAAGAHLELKALDGLFTVASATNVVVVDGLEVELVAPNARPRYEVRGVLLDPDGAPVVGVEFEDGSNPFSDWLATGVVTGGNAVTCPGPDGRFVLVVDTPRVVVRGHEGDRSSIGVLCEFSPMRPMVEIVLQLRRTVITRGTVDVGSVAPSLVRVMAVDPSAEEANGTLFAEVRPDGTFEIPLPAGSHWQLSAGGDLVDVVAGQQGVRLGLAKPVPERAEVRLQVVPPTGKALGFPWAEWMWVGDARIEREPASFVCQDGYAEVHHPRTSPWRLVVHDGASAAHVDVDETAIDLGRVFLLPPARLTATVRRAGRVMRGLDVLVEGCGPPEASRGNARGVHQFAQLPHGPAFVHVRRGAEVLATQRVDLLPGQTSEVSFDLP